VKNLKSWVSPKVIVKNRSKIHGRGIFAKEKIKKNEIIGEYGGVIVGSKTAHQIFETFGDYLFQVNKNSFIVPQRETNFVGIAFCNHSCNPNCGWRNKRTVVAMRDIKKGEELTLDYAMDGTDEPFPKKYPSRFNCLCKSKNCRKIITGQDWRRKDLQKKYAGYFSPYIAGKIKNLNSD